MRQHRLPGQHLGAERCDGSGAGWRTRAGFAVVAGEVRNLAQVGKTVVQIDQATQQNPSLVEESASVVDSLKQQAQRLVKAVSVFQLWPDLH